MRKIFPFELFHLGGDEVNTGQYETLAAFLNFANNHMTWNLKLLNKGLIIIL